MKNFSIISALVIAVTVFGTVAFAAPRYTPLPTRTYPIRTGTNTSTSTVKTNIDTSNNNVQTNTQISVSNNSNPKPSTIISSQSVCPINTTLLANTLHCVDGTNIYGNFSTGLVVKCLNFKGGNACESKNTYTLPNSQTTMLNKWSYKFYQSLNK
jgi:hypothetical protein